MSKKYVLLCDYGLDDACATLLLLDSRNASDQVDILPIGGNSEVNVAYRNAHTLLANYDGDLTNVRIVDTRNEKQPFVKLVHVHGEDGMGDVLAPKQAPVPVLTYAEWITQDDQPIILVSLGPCTMTKDILAKRKVEMLLVMGGCVAQQPNYNGYEFNHALDVEAFNESVKFNNTFVATLDSCRTPRFNYAGKKFDESKLLGKMLNRTIALATLRHEDRCYVYDYVAVTYLLKPDTFTVTKSIDPSGNLINELKSKF